MYTNFSIKNFRCFRDFTIENLSKINLIAGKNNAGKTTLLESLFIHSNAYDPELLLKLLVFRGIDTGFLEKYLIGNSPWGMNYLDFDNTRHIIFKSRDLDENESCTKLHDWDEKSSKELFTLLRDISDLANVDSNWLKSKSNQVLYVSLEHKEKNEKVHTCKMSIINSKIKVEHSPSSPPPPPFYVSFRNDKSSLSLAETAQLYSDLVWKENENVLIETLRILEPQLEKLELVVSQGDMMLFAKIGNKPLMPIYLMGQGIVLLSSIILQLSYAVSGIFLIDEIDNGLHHSIIEKVWEAIGKAAQEFNTQVFATTHSFECIQAAHVAFSSKPEDFRYFRLDKRGNDIVAQTYDDETLGASIDMNLEVR